MRKSIYLIKQLNWLAEKCVLVLIWAKNFALDRIAFNQ